MAPWQLLKETLTLPSNHVSFPFFWLYLFFIYYNYSFASLIYTGMNTWLKEEEICIICWLLWLLMGEINQNEREHLSWVRHGDLLTVPSGWMFVVLLGKRGTSQSVPLELSAWACDRGWEGRGGQRGGGEGNIMPWHVSQCRIKKLVEL